MADVTVTKTVVSLLAGHSFRGSAGGTLTAGDVTYLDGASGHKRADASAAETAQVAGLLVAPQDAANGDTGLDLAAAGAIIGGFSGLTPGDLLYLSDTAGKLSTTPGTQAKACARAISATEIHWTLEGIDPS